MNKYSKAEVNFEHPAKGPDHCKDCKHYKVVPYHSCEIVPGVIMPNDWCKKFVAKSVLSRAMSHALGK